MASNDGEQLWGADEARTAHRVYLSFATGGAFPVAETTSPAAEGAGDEKMSKNAIKKLQKGKPPKAPKDANRWAVDETKKAAKIAEKAAKAKADADRDAAEAALQIKPKKGEKKILTKEMASVYLPHMVEESWQDWWEASGFYSADAEAGEKAGPEGRFVICLPPPNVTGSLHLGHALTAAIEDTLSRWHRMKGEVTLYLPGVDHAGIATQSVVEKQLMKEQGKTRYDLGREAFVSKVFEWKQEYGNKICRQIRELGSSVDWSREAFTMDEKCSKAVKEAFCRFYEKGILFRDKRLINWSCKLKSAISDIEVEHEDIEGGAMIEVPGHTKQKKYQFGMFTEFAYRVQDSEELLIVATTRLETMLGDVAVAVHPKDERYKHLHGKFVVHPFHERLIPIILDDVLVDMELGTGAVKITPAHDPNDYECGKRHNLPFITVLNPDGSMNEEAGQFQGMMRYDARIEVEKALEAKGLLIKKYPKPMNIGFCSRSHDIIEPMVMPQWFVDCENMANRACEAVNNGQLKIHPEFHKKTWFQWLTNCRPWCVSRQLWWGHRIPAYFATLKSEDIELIDKNSDSNKDRWVVGRNEEEAKQKACVILKCKPNEVNLMQDEDVLDTWFSSGLFPFSTMGWPDNTPDLKGFFPNSLLETGFDILFFWVARMVMMSLELTDQLPFTDVYLHAMVRDKDGRKMSKSLGNVIDPLEVIHGCPMKTLHARLDEGNLAAKEVARAKNDFTNAFGETDGIPKCGADALRIGLLAYTVQGRDINLDIKRVVGYRSFCNKLWQSCRFLIGCFGDYLPDASSKNNLLLKPFPRDVFILSKLNEAVIEVTRCFEEYEFGKAVQALDVFFRGKLCDVYLELVKPSVYCRDDNEEANHARNQSRAVLWTCLDTFLRLLHPMCPFVTEELWQRLPGRFGKQDDDDGKNAEIKDEKTKDEKKSKKSKKKKKSGKSGGGGAATAESSPNPPAPAQSIMVAQWPLPEKSWSNPDADAKMELLLGCIETARSLRAAHNLAKKTTQFIITCDNETLVNQLLKQEDDFMTLALATKVFIVTNDSEKALECKLYPMGLVGDTIKVYFDPKSVGIKNTSGGEEGNNNNVKVDNSLQLKKLQKEISTLTPLVKKLEGKMNNEGYLSKVPPAALAKDKEKLEQYSKMLKEATEALSLLS
jgi:valyl-tRNA synthetase